MTQKTGVVYAVELFTGAHSAMQASDNLDHVESQPDMESEHKFIITLSS